MFGTKNTSVTYGALIDVGSGSVGVGIVESDRSKKLPRIIYSERIPMRLPSEDNSEARLRTLREAIFSASLNLSNIGLLQLRKEKPKARITRILTTCSSPWSRTITRTIHFDREEQFRVTPSLLAELSKVAEDKIEEELKESEVVSNFGFRIVERANVSTKINGYTIDEPEGLRGVALDLSHLTGLVAEDVVESLEDIKENMFEHATFSTHTYLLVYYCVLRDLYPKATSFTLVDISGEATKLGIVDEGVLSFSSFAPYGSNTLLRNMGKNAKSPIGHSLSLLHSYEEGTLSENEFARVEKYLLEYREALVKKFSSVFGTRAIPQVVIVTSLPEVKGVLSKQAVQALQEATGADHTLMDVEDHFLHEITAGIEDVFLAISGRFFHKLHGCGELD